MFVGLYVLARNVSLYDSQDCNIDVGFLLSDREVEIEKLIIISLIMPLILSEMQRTFYRNKNILKSALSADSIFA